MSSLTDMLKKISRRIAVPAAVAMLGFGITAAVYELAGPVPVAAQVGLPPGPWTAIGASGTVDETSIPFFGFTNASAMYGPNASLAPLEFRYNITNVPHPISSTGGIPTLTQPGWTTLEFGAQAPGTSIADAYLYRVNRCTGQQTLICYVHHNNTPAPGTCRQCQFANTTFDFANYLYYVRVVLDRNTQAEQPAAHTLRIS